MNPSEGFCTCKNRNCPLHPSNHDKGCTPCISKNLKAKEVPACYLNLADPDGTWQGGDSLREFAACILENEKKL